MFSCLVTLGTVLRRKISIPFLHELYRRPMFKTYRILFKTHRILFKTHCILFKPIVFCLKQKFMRKSTSNPRVRTILRLGTYINRHK